MATGAEDDISPDDAARALDEARADQVGTYAARSVGFGMIHTSELYDGGDHHSSWSR